MTNATSKEEREYIFMPFGEYRGIEFPHVPIDYLRFMREDMKKCRDEEYPGLRQSISEFLAGRQQRDHWQWQEWKAESDRTMHEQWAQESKQNKAEREKRQRQASNDDWFNEAFRNNFNQHNRQYRPPQRATVIADKQKAKEIIAAGRRALAMKHHPDNGGSEEAMKAYNAAADWLEGLL